MNKWIEYSRGLGESNSMSNGFGECLRCLFQYSYSYSLALSKFHDDGGGQSSTCNDSRAIHSFVFWFKVNQRIIFWWIDLNRMSSLELPKCFKKLTPCPGSFRFKFPPPIHANSPSKRQGESSHEDPRTTLLGKEVKQEKDTIKSSLGSTLIINTQDIFFKREHNLQRRQGRFKIIFSS